MRTKELTIKDVMDRHSYAKYVAIDTDDSGYEVHLSAYRMMRDVGDNKWHEIPSIKYYRDGNPIDYYTLLEDNAKEIVASIKELRRVIPLIKQDSHGGFTTETDGGHWLLNPDGSKFTLPIDVSFYGDWEGLEQVLTDTLNELERMVTPSWFR